MRKEEKACEKKGRGREKGKEVSKVSQDYAKGGREGA
jgi:hypothetical protein